MTMLSDSSNLTGATRYRDGWFGGLILQVEERCKMGHNGRNRLVFSWRDAKAWDLLAIERLEREERAERMVVR